MELIKFLIQLLKGILCVFQLAAGFHLSRNTADVLTTVQCAIINTAFNVAGLTSCNAADVIANMLIAHVPFVDTGADHTGVFPCNAADIGDRCSVFGGENIGQCSIQINGGKINTVIRWSGVDTAVAGAVFDAAFIGACNAARQVAAIYGSLGNAIRDNAAYFIYACNTTYLTRATDTAGNMASADQTIIAAGKESKPGMILIRNCSAGYG